MNQAPRLVDAYAIAEVLGEGAMGTVYVAHQQEPVRRTVALKILKATPDPLDVLDRFEAERQALAVMDHPSIARVFDAGITDDGSPYVVMERVQGPSILSYCDDHRLTIRDRIALFAKVCHAVQHAHQKGVIHRDLKPEHILISEVDGQPLPKIIDFGIAIAVDPEVFARSRSEESDNVVGTPAYMSPEQINGSSDIDTRSDIYSLGIILYELLVGAAPYDLLGRAGWSALAAQIVSDPPTPTARFRSLDDTQDTVANLRQTTPERLRRELHDDLDWVVTRAMTRDRGGRYETAHELAIELERYLAGQPVQAHPPSTAYHTRKFVRRHRLTVSLASVSALSLLAFALTASIQANRIAQARAEADTRRTQAEGLIDFMLSDLRERLESVGRLDVLDAVGDRALEYFAQISPDEYSNEELASRSQALYQIGDVRMEQGRLPEAGRAFDESLELARALSEREPANNDWLFEVGQAEFYAGNRYRVQGDLDQALAHFRSYRDVSDSLASRDRESLVYQLEVGYSHTNVGTIHHALGNLEDALTEFTQSLSAKRRVAEADRENSRRRYDIGQGHNLLGVLLKDMGQLQGAREHFEADVAIKDSLVVESPENATFLYRLAVARHFLAGILHAQGDVTGALEQYRGQRDILTPLVEGDSSNLRWARNMNAADAREAHTLLDAGRLEEAERRATSSVARQQRLVVLNLDQPGWQADLASARRGLARILLKAGRADEARGQADAAVAAVRELVGRHENQATYIVDLAQSELLLGDVLLALGRVGEARTMHESSVNRLEPFAPGSTDADVLETLATGLLRIARPEDARGLLAELDAMGYAMPELAPLRRAAGIEER